MRQIYTYNVKAPKRKKNAPVNRWERDECNYLLMRIKLLIDLCIK